MYVVYCDYLMTKLLISISPHPDEGWVGILLAFWLLFLGGLPTFVLALGGV